MYSAKNSNVYYTQKKIGTKTEPLDKCILGWCFLILCLGITVGPFIIFSNIGGFVAPNYVTRGEIRMAFIIDHNLTLYDQNELDHHYNSTYEHLVF